jgi:hypothetical protein
MYSKQVRRWLVQVVLLVVAVMGVLLVTDLLLEAEELAEVWKDKLACVQLPDHSASSTMHV